MFRFLLALLPCAAWAFDWTQHYAIEDVPQPPGFDFQVGGMDFTKDGQLIVCLHRGEVMSFDEKSQCWSLFASGLHEPLGLMVDDDGSVVVVQRAELTRLSDTNQDGQADLYETISDDWGMTGNYHEFAFGLVKDSQGRFYVSLGTASNGSGVRDEIRGPWSEIGGLTHDRFKYGKGRPWSEVKPGTPRMYARVPYRGCVIRITPGEREAELYATGFRTPNGLYIDDQDQLWVTDNQGDWLGSSKLFRVEENQFHGHPASLLWDENPPSEIPAEMDKNVLDEMRIKSAAFFPQGDSGNSPTQVLPIPNSDSFAPPELSGHLLVGEMNHALLNRFLPDVVNGQHQGAAVHFLRHESLANGNNRMVFSPNKKSLYIGKTKLSWPGFRGIKKVTYLDNPYLTTTALNLTPDGFRFTFNEAIEANFNEKDFKIESYSLDYHASYGSKKREFQTQGVRNFTLNGNTLELVLEERPIANRIYDISLPEILGKKLGPLAEQRFFYTAHQTYSN